MKTLTKAKSSGAPLARCSSKRSNSDARPYWFRVQITEEEADKCPPAGSLARDRQAVCAAFAAPLRPLIERASAMALVTYYDETRQCFLHILATAAPGELKRGFANGITASEDVSGFPGRIYAPGTW